MYETIKRKLEGFPPFRERRLRAKYLAYLALEASDLKDKWEADIALDLNDLSEFATSYDSHRRLWNKVMEENPHLQGKDYEDKEVLDQQKQMELGYEPQPLKIHE